MKASQKAGDANDLDDDTRTRLQRRSCGRQAERRRTTRTRCDCCFRLAQTYWGDVAYVAERILTVDELKSFVDGLPPADAETAGAPRRTSPCRGRSAPKTCAPAGAAAGARGTDWPRRCRISGIRRPLVDDPAERESTRRRTAYRAGRRGGPADLALAQRLARRGAVQGRHAHAHAQGMELMGTEGPPDVAALDGNFSWGVRPGEPAGHRRHHDPHRHARSLARAGRGDPFRRQRAQARHAASTTAPSPPTGRSRPPTCCRTALRPMPPPCAGRRASPTTATTRTRATSIYRRYVATGPLPAVGQDASAATCPDPDFDAARDYWPKRIVRLAQRHTGLAAAAALVIALLLAGSVFAIRRRRQSAALQAKLAASSWLPLPV